MVPYLNRESYIPRGSTALHDAVGRSIKRLGEELAARPEDKRPSKVIVLIQTDGQENASKTYSQWQINEMTKHQREKYGWEFIFAGTNQDAVQVASTIGIPAASSIYYSNTAYGTNNVWAALTSNVSAARTYGTAVCFNSNDRSSSVDPNDVSGWATTVINNASGGAVTTSATVPTPTITTTVPSTTSDTTSDGSVT